MASHRHNGPGRNNKGWESHAVVREGVLLEKVFKNDNSSRRMDVEATPSFQEDDQDEWENESLEGASQGTQVVKKVEREFLGWKQRDALLFANGNLVLRPSEKKGFRIWPFKKPPKKERMRVVPLDSCAFKRIKYEWEHQLYIFHLFPHGAESNELVLGATTESAAQGWFNDIIGVAASTGPRKNGQQNFGVENFVEQGQAGAREVAEILRARESWKQAFFELRAGVSELPKRHWNLEFSPRFSKGDVLSSFRLWRDYTAFSSYYVREIGTDPSAFTAAGNGSKEETNKVLPPHFASFSSALVPPVSFQEMRMGDAIQHFFDTKGVLLVLSEDDNVKIRLQVSASLSTLGGEKAVLCPHTPAVLDEDWEHLRDRYTDAVATVFCELFEVPHSLSYSSILILPNGSTVLVDVPFDKTKRDQAISALLGSTSSRFQPLRLELFGAKMLFLRHTSEVQENKLVSEVLNRSIRGNVLLFPQPNRTFLNFFRSSSLFLRPEYPSCRLDLFREHFVRFNKAKRITREKGPALHEALERSNITLAQDMIIHCTFAAAARLERHTRLISHPWQIVWLLHNHGARFTGKSIAVFLRCLGDTRISQLMQPDLMLYKLEGNLKLAKLVLEQSLSWSRDALSSRDDFTPPLHTPHDNIVAAWCRMSGITVEVSKILKGFPESIASPEDLRDYYDVSYEGFNTSYLTSCNQWMYIQRLSRGLNRFTVRDQTDTELFKAHPIEARNQLATAAMVLNRCTYSVDHNSSRNERKLQSSPLFSTQQYGSLVSKIFHPASQRSSGQKAKHHQNKLLRNLMSQTPVASQATGSQDQKEGSWWLQTKKVPYDAAACVSWLQVCLSNVSEYVSKKRGPHQIRNALEAVCAAEDMLRSTTSILWIPCIILKAVLTERTSLMLFTIKVIREQPYVREKRFISIILSRLLGSSSLSLNDKQHIRELMAKNEMASFLISQKRFLQRTALQKDLMEPFIFDSQTMVSSPKLDDLLLSYFQYCPKVMGEEAIFEKENSASTFELSPSSSMAAQQASSMYESRQRTASQTSDDSRKDSISSAPDSGVQMMDAFSTETLKSIATAKVANSVVVLGPRMGFSSDQEQSIREEASLNGTNSPEVEMFSPGFESTLRSSIGPDNVEIGLASLSKVTILEENAFPSRVKISNIACGNRHTAIVTNTGVLLTFGNGSGGRLGHGSEENMAIPLPVAFFVRSNIHVNNVACGRDHTIAICREGHRQGIAYAWGWGEAGRLGQGREVGVQATPLRISILRDGSDSMAAECVELKRAACGFEHTLLLSEDGKVYSCGAGGFGRLGHGKGSDQLTPTRILSNLEDERVLAVAAGDAHSMALSSKGVVFSWGFGRSGALGHGDLDNRMEPKRIALLEDNRQIKSIGCGAYHSVALDTNGRVWTWGDNENGHLGIEKSSQNQREHMIPRMVRFKGRSSEGGVIVSISCGTQTTVVTDENGNIFSWGSPEGVKPPVQVPTRILTSEAEELLESGSWDGKHVLIGVGSYHLVAAFCTEAFSQSLPPRLEPTLTRLKTKMQSELEPTEQNPQSEYFGQSFRSEFNQALSNPMLKSSTAGASDTHVYFAGCLDQRISLSHLEKQTEEIRNRNRDLLQFNFFGPKPPHDLFAEVYPAVSFREPKLLEGLSGTPIVSAAGNLTEWMFTSSDQTVHRWGMEDASIRIVHEFDFLEVSCETVCSSPTGEWMGAICGKRFDSHECSSMIAWKPFAQFLGEEDRSNLNPALLWPFHQDMVLRQVAIGKEILVVLDADGVVYEMHCDKRTTPTTPEEVSSPKRGGRRQPVLPASSPEMSERIQRFYQKYCPEKLKLSPEFLPTMLTLYRNKEAELLKLLEAKYGPEPTIREANSPIGFSRQVPRIVTMPTTCRVIQAACGRTHALVLTDQGQVFTWGGESNSPVLGIGPPPFPPQEVPKQVRFDRGMKTLIARVAAGLDHCACISMGGALYTWGIGGYGELGHGNTVAQFIPKRVAFFHSQGLSVSRVACGSRHTVAVTTCGRAFSWGLSVSGALGLRSMEDDDSQPPKPLPTIIGKPQQVRFEQPESVQSRTVRVLDAFAASTSTVFVARHSMVDV